MFVHNDSKGGSLWLAVTRGEDSGREGGVMGARDGKAYPGSTCPLRIHSTPRPLPKSRKSHTSSVSPASPARSRGSGPWGSGARARRLSPLLPLLLLLLLSLLPGHCCCLRWRTASCLVSLLVPPLPVHLMVVARLSPLLLLLLLPDPQHLTLLLLLLLLLPLLLHHHHPRRSPRPTSIASA